MNLMPRVIDYFPDYMTTDSLFQKMVDFGAPWDEDLGEDMDISYFTMYSGSKYVTNLVKQNSVNSIAKSKVIAKLLWNIYGKNWLHLWKAYSSEYTPTDNYNITEDSQRDIKDNRNIDRTTSDTQTGDVTDTTTYGQQVTVDDDVNQFNYGFNSSEEVPIHHVADNTTTSYSGEDKTVSDRNLTSAGTSNTTDNDVVDDHLTRTRQGNIGQTSYQDLLRQEFELWKWNFFTQVFNDVDRFLCLSVFCPFN